MTLPTGTHKLGPDDTKLTVNTGKAGAIAVAGHNLLIEVGSWSATLELGADGAGSSLTLEADSRSLRVLEGTGGVQSLGDDDKVGITKTIDEDVLKGRTIAFRSTSVRADGDRLQIEGELELLGKRRPLTFELQTSDDGHIAGQVAFKQSDWGMKPYSALFGTLKVADELKVSVDGHLAAS
jgi:polyisoprenoid-binding protein YceI